MLTAAAIRLPKKPVRAALALLLAACPLAVAADEVMPSALMRTLPAIPAVPQAQDCAATDALLVEAEQHAGRAMVRSQQMMATMTMGGSAITDRQGELIARLLDPQVSACEMNAALALPAEHPETAYREELRAIDGDTRAAVEAKCPVVDFADYREQDCVEPLVRQGLQRERAALQKFVAAANARLNRETETYVRCAAVREQLAQEAEAAKLPVQYRAMALAGASNGWQQLDTLVQHRRALCETAASAERQLRERESAL